MSRIRNAARVAGAALGRARDLADAVDEARRIYERFHWDDEPDELVETDRVPSLEDGDVLVVLGELVRVDYATHKGDDDAIWYHEFAHRRPQLCLAPDGRLVIVGGDYRVTRRGIVG